MIINKDYNKLNFPQYLWNFFFRYGIINYERVMNMDINEIKRNLINYRQKINDLWRSL